MGEGSVAVPARVIESFLRDATLRGERAIALLRAVAISLLLLRRLLLSTSELLQADPKVWLIVGGLVLAAFAALFSHILLTRGRFQSALILSVFADAALVFLAVLPRALWAPEFTFGILNDFSSAGFLVMTAAVGVRLSPLVTRVGITFNILFLLTLLVIEAQRWGDRLIYTQGQYTMAAILMMGAAGIAWAMSERTRQLVFEGARATLLAEKTRQRLGVYVSEEIADLSLRESELAPGGVREKVAVLFSDLRGFTDYAEQLDPERLVSELNDYLDVMVSVVKREGGVVDKYIGDSIMVVFGVPRPDGKEALRALKTAWAMEQALAEHNLERKRKGRSELRHGIGVHYGDAVAGNIGARERLQFTVVGDVVNLASRLEASTKTEGVSVLISSQVVEAARKSMTDGDELPGALRRYEKIIEVRGRREKVAAYTFSPST